MTGTTLLTPPVVGQTILRWSSRTHTLAGIEAELARIWSEAPLTAQGADGTPERRVAARTSVLNLAVVARQPELAGRAAARPGSAGAVVVARRSGARLSQGARRPRHGGPPRGGRRQLVRRW